MYPFGQRSLMDMQGIMHERPAWESGLAACMADIQQHGKMTARLQMLAEGVRKDAKSLEAWQAFLQSAQSAGAAPPCVSLFLILLGMFTNIQCTLKNEQGSRSSGDRRRSISLKISS